MLMADSRTRDAWCPYLAMLGRGVAPAGMSRSMALQEERRSGVLGITMEFHGCPRAIIQYKIVRIFPLDIHLECCSSHHKS